jgi:site-specific DNA-methyltransferase (adenine-specific)
LAFSAARTYHHLAITLEQAGFEIRDQIMWIYSSGFPKSQDVGKSIAKANNELINTKTYMPDIDDNRNVAFSSNGSPRCKLCNTSGWVGRNKCSRDNCIQPWIPDHQDNNWNGWGTQLKPAHEPIALARKPLEKNNSIARNCQQWGVGALNIDATRIDWNENEKEITNIRRQNVLGGKIVGGGIEKYATVEEDAEDKHTTQRVLSNEQGRFPSNVLGEILQDDYQKYFYCPKVSRKERSAYNNHPTVKPVELMKYLIKLITPPGGIVLDPFNGSGSTGMAAVELGHEYIGCELDPAYVAIAEKRIRDWNTPKDSNTTFEQLFE